MNEKEQYNRYEYYPFALGKARNNKEVAGTALKGEEPEPILPEYKL